MKVAEYLKKINKSKNPIKMDRWLDLKQYYMSMYRFYMLKLYDMGYISDPTRFVEVEILQNLIDMGIYDFRDSIGLVILKSNIADFTRCKYKNDEDKYNFLNILYKVLKYKEYCLELDKQYELNQSEVRLSFALKDSIMVSSLCTIDYNKGVFSALCKDGYLLDEVSINEHIFKYAMETLGISNKCFSDGMFVKGMSLEDTIKFSNLILEGEVALTGTYSNMLLDWLSENTENGKGLYYHTCKYYSEQLSDIIDKETSKYGDDFMILYLDKIYFKKPISKYRLPSSMFVCVSAGDDVDVVETDWSALYGYTGESYTKEFLDSQYIDYVGIPLITNVNGTEFQVYDSSQLIVVVEQDSWFKVDEMSFVFDENFSLKNPYQKGTIEHALVESYIEGQKGNIFEVDSSIGTIKEIKSARKKLLPKFIRLLNS